MLKDYDNALTDKNTLHSYLDVYELLLRNRKTSAKNIMELGIWKGGALLLFHDYFQNASIYGIDVLPITNVDESVLSKERIHCIPDTNAYSDETIIKIKELNIKFDFILDDGDHTETSMIYYIKNYLDFLTSDGILIIEDFVGGIEMATRVLQTVPALFKDCSFIIDRRPIKNRFDDIVLVIDKSLLTN